MLYSLTDEHPAIAPRLEYGNLYHQATLGFKPIGGRTVIRRISAPEKAGSIIIPEAYRGRTKSAWQAEVVEVSGQGGWRVGDLHDNRRYPALEYGWMTEVDPASLTKAQRRGPWWKTRPYFVRKPEHPPGTRILCCYMTGIPIRRNGFDYFICDGEHFYLAIIPQ